MQKYKKYFITTVCFLLLSQKFLFNLNLIYFKLSYRGLKVKYLKNIVWLLCVKNRLFKISKAISLNFSKRGIPTYFTLNAV